jgi:hypothetical protein
MGPPEEYADARVKQPPGPGEDTDGDEALRKKVYLMLDSIDQEGKEQMDDIEEGMHKSYWARNRGRSGCWDWRDNTIEEEQQRQAEKTERDVTAKRVEFALIALAAHDEAEHIKRRERLPRWEVKDKDDPEIPTYCDSGSNVNVTSLETALWLEDLGFVYKVREPGEEKDFIVFGKKEAKSEIIGYVEGEGLIDRLAVVKDIEANLISADTFTQRGMDVVFRKNDVLIMQGETMRFRGERDSQSALYKLDIVDLLMTPGDEDGATTDESESESESESEIEIESESDRRARGKAGHKWRAAYTARAKPRFKAQAIRRAMELHRHMKHIPLAIMALNIECGAWTGLDPMITPQLLRELAAQNRCIVCAAARWNQKVHHGSGARVYLPGEAFALDYQGLISPMSFGCNGFIVIRDLGTGFFEVYGVRDKTAVTEAVQRWTTFMLSFGHTPKFGRHDSGSVETGNQFRTALAALGINTIASPPEIPEKNIERTVQTIQNDIAAMMASTPSFGAKDWLFAAKHSARMRSTMVCAASKAHHPDKSPYELICRKKPRVDLLTDIAVGDIAVIRTPLKLRRLGQPRNQVARVMELELDDARAAKVQVLGSERISRRGNLQKVHIETAEEETTGKPRRVVTMVTAADGTTTVTASPGLETDSIETVARAEMKLANDREFEEVEKIRENLQKAIRPEPQSDGEEDEDEKADAGKYVDADGNECADGKDGGAVGTPYWEDEKDAEEEDQTSGAIAFWTRHLSSNKVPDKDTVDEVWTYSRMTGGAMPSDELMARATNSSSHRGDINNESNTHDDEDDEDDDDDDGEGDSDGEGEGTERYFTALKARKVSIVITKCP